jgi:hypothetical protein
MSASLVCELGSSSARQIEVLRRAIQCRLGGRVIDFELHIHPDGVKLKGVACSYYVKQLAQHLVMEADLCPISSNEIEVDFDLLDAPIALTE